MPHRLLARGWVAWMPWALFWAGCAVPEHRYGGPLPVRTQAPAELQVFDLGPRRAKPVPAGSLEVRAQLFWTNTILAGRPSGGERFLFDYELVRLSWPLRVGLGAGFDLELEPGLQWAGAGVLDGPIDEWHKLFGFPRGFRPEFPKNSFGVFVERDGERAFELKRDRIVATDLPVVFARRLLGEHPWLPSLLGRIGVELPVGDPKLGAGNGGWDVGCGLVAQRRFGSVEVTADLSWVRPATPPAARRLGIDYASRFSGGLGAELPLADGLALLAQLRSHQSVLGNFEAGRLNRPHLLLWIGGRLELGAGLFAEASLGEDLIMKVSPDVSFHFGLGGRF